MLLVLVSDSTQLLCNEHQEQVRILVSILERAASGSEWETEKLASLRMLFQCELEEADGFVPRLHGAGRTRKNACSMLASCSCGSPGCTSYARNPSAIFAPATRRAFIGQGCFAQTRFCELRPETVSKGIRGRSGGIFGPRIGAKMGRTRRFGCLVGPRFGYPRDFSDGFRSVFSEVRAENLHPAISNGPGPPQAREKPGRSLGRGISEGVRPNDNRIVVPRRARARTPNE